jgi:precorrin-8X/cobalt-precorrin-8 methylmutase
VESKKLLVKQCWETVPFLTLSGRRGGSAMAAAAVNALAKKAEISVANNINIQS